MDIQHIDDGKKGKFFIEVDGNIEGEMIYTWAGPDKFIIEHTEVSEKLKGMNAGKQMVKKAVEFAREKQVKILPLCPFAHAIIMKTQEYHDIL